jgi:glutaconate CoA-transferase subunit B
MELTALYPGITLDAMRAAVGWALTVRARVDAVEPPTANELTLLRDVLDPQKRYLSGAA